MRDAFQQDMHLVLIKIISRARLFTSAKRAEYKGKLSNLTNNYIVYKATYAPSFGVFLFLENRTGANKIGIAPRK